MNKMLTTSVVCFMISAPCFSEEIVHSVTPGLGVFEDVESGSNLTVSETETGFSVDFLVTEPGAGLGLPLFENSWESESWMKIHFNKITRPLDFQSTTKFNPFNEPDGGVRVVTEATEFLPPTSKTGLAYSLVAFVCETPDCPIGRFVLDYSIETIDSPIPGDFNYNNAVEFGDFLILSANFGLNPKSWRDGDTTLDGRVNFDDFLILSSNFGTVREPVVASVPEPSAGSVLCLALVGLMCCRQGRRY